MGKASLRQRPYMEVNALQLHTGGVLDAMIKLNIADYYEKH